MSESTVNEAGNDRGSVTVVLPKADPFTVECRKCGARVHFQCRTPTGFVARIHKERWRDIGVKKPTLEQIVSLYRIGQKHQDIINRNQRARP